MAIKKYVDIEVNTKQAVKSLDDLGGTFEDVYGEIQPLNTVIGELEDRLYQMAGNGEQATEEFKLLSKQVGDYKKVIIDTDLAIDSMSQTTAQNLGGALGGITAGFELGAGAMGAMGVEAEVVEAQLLKVQSAMAIAQGVQGIKEAIPNFKALTAGIMKTAAAQKVLTIAQGIGAAAMKALNFIMNLNPVFLLITAFAALGAAIYAYSGEVENVKELNDEFNKSLERQNTLLDKTLAKVRKSNEHKLKLMEAEGAGEKELHEQRLKMLKIDELGRQAQLKLIENEVNKKSKLLQKAIELDQQETADAIKEELAATNEKYESLKAMNQDYNRNVELEEIAHNKKLDDQRDERLAKYKQYLQDRKDADIEAEDIRLQLLADGEFKDIEILNAQAERKRNQILEDTKYTQEERQELLRLYDLKREQDEQAVRDRYLEAEKVHQEKVEAQKPEPPDFSNPEGMVEVQAEVVKGQRILEIQKAFNDESEKMHAITESKKWKQTEAGLANAMSALNSLQALSDAVTENQLAKAEGNEAKQEEIRKKAFERNKKLQLTMAVVQGIQGVMAAYTAGSSMGPAGVVMGPLMAALAAVTAGVNIAKIKNTSYGGGATSGASVPQDASSRVPSFNIVGNSPQNQLAQSLGGQEQEPIKTYVVSGEVSTAQSLDRNRVKTASL